jgi:hypothetical protein
MTLESFMLGLLLYMLFFFLVCAFVGTVYLQFLLLKRGWQWAVRWFRSANHTPS